MDVSITDISDVEKEIHIQATAGELEPHFERAYREYLPKVEIRGFRKGKAPLSLVKKLYGETIEHGALDTIASDVYREVVRAHDIRPIGDPVLTDIDYKRGEALSFRIKYEVIPPIELREYRGIPVEKLVHRVTDQEVEDELARLRRSNSTLEEVLTATDDQHIVTADIQQLDPTGTPLIGQKTADARLYLEDQSIYDEIRDALRNVSVGTQPRASVEATDQSGAKRTMHIEIRVKKIEKIHLPELNGEFVKRLTKDRVTSVEEFRKRLRDDLESYWRERSDRQVTDTLIAEIVRRHDFQVPESIVRGVLDSLLEDLRNRYPNKKLPQDFNEEDFRQQNRAYAIFQAKWYLIRDRIIEAEQITTTDEDIERQVEADAPSMGIEKDRLLSFYKTSEPVKNRLVSAKLINLLLGEAIVTERIEDGSDLGGNNG